MVGIVGREILRINTRGGARDALLTIGRVRFIALGCHNSDVLEPGLEGTTLNDGDFTA